MAMNDEETVALIAGGHAFGKSHGMVAAKEVGPPPEIAPIERWPWLEKSGGHRLCRIYDDERHRRQLTPNPTQWDNSYLENLFKFEWEQTKSPAARCNGRLLTRVRQDPDAHIPAK